MTATYPHRRARALPILLTAVLCLLTGAVPAHAGVFNPSQPLGRGTSSPASASTFPWSSPLSQAGAHPRPGVRAAAPTQAQLDATLQQATGLDSSQVAAQHTCDPAPADQASCAAQVLVLRSNHRRVRARTGARSTFTQVFPRRKAGIAPSAVPAGSTGVSAPQADTPAWLQQAYDLTYLSQTAGTSDTVGIVDAYDYPNAEADLATFRSTYGLPACTTANGCFKKVNEQGQQSNYPSAGSGWEMEEALDLDGVSALCPNCHIILVEANVPSFTDLSTAVQTAVALGANQVSNSYGADIPNSAAYANSFPWSAPGVATLYSTGDNGYVSGGSDDYPASIPSVTAVGGTSIASGVQSARGFGESAWSGAGSGCNPQEAKPSYQADTGCTGRSYADVSADANPSTGLVTYDSGDGGWLLVGGTSLASPLTAAYEAVTGINAVSPQWAYTSSSLLNDPVSGSVGTCAASIVYICNAGVGYDGPTGMGSISGALVKGGPGIGGAPYGSLKGYQQSTTSTGATLTAGVYPNGIATSYYWQYGTSTSYGQQTTSTDIGSGTAPAQLTSTLTGLAPATTYHYRLVATNSAATVYGYDYSLTTASTPPTNTAPAAISGTPTQGQALGVTYGTWVPANGVTFTYQWQSSPDGTGSWTNISGATLGIYNPQASDVGDYLRAVIIATDTAGSGTANSNTVGPIASAAPVNTAKPTIAGTTKQGQVLTTTLGTWTATNLAYGYAWQRSTDGSNWQAISGAYTSSYTLTKADEGASIRASVTATNNYGQASATSPAVGPVAGDPPVNTVAPFMSGTSQRTFTLSVTQGTWSGGANVYTYQWQRSADGKAWSSIAGADRLHLHAGSGRRGPVCPRAGVGLEPRQYRLGGLERDLGHRLALSAGQHGRPDGLRHRPAHLHPHRHRRHLDRPRPRLLLPLAA